MILTSLRSTILLNIFYLLSTAAVFLIVTHSHNSIPLRERRKS